MTIDNGACDFCGIAVEGDRHKRVLGDDDPTVWCLVCPAGGVFVFRYASNEDIEAGMAERRDYIERHGGLDAMADDTNPYQRYLIDAQQYLNAAGWEMYRRGRYPFPYGPVADLL